MGETVLVFHEAERRLVPVTTNGRLSMESGVSPENTWVCVLKGSQTKLSIFSSSFKVRNGVNCLCS